MWDMLILGTDTDAGKTTLALMWLTAWAEEYVYWKPVETGPSDTRTIAELVPAATIHPPVLRLQSPVAPPLAARREQATVPGARELGAALPRTNRSVLVESFGSPFSPLNENELQVELVRELKLPTILVSRDSLGTIGRTLQCWTALESQGLAPRAIVLMGEEEEDARTFAVEKICQFGEQVDVYCLRPPAVWNVAGLRDCVARQMETLRNLRQTLTPLLARRAPTDLVERDRRVVWHPYTPLQGADAPLVCVGAEDEFLYLADGRRVIDGISSWWTILHGHRFAPLMKALDEARQKFDHVHFAGVTHAPAIELAELLLADVPWAGGRVFYSDNGSTAVEVALKMAYQFWCHHHQPHRTRFVGFEHGYHGDTFGAMAVSRDPVFFGRFEPLLLQADILPLDPNRLDEHLRQHPVAGVILEPLVQGAGGMRMHSPETLRHIFEVTREHDVLFLADEVMTGGGRTGSLWAHQQAGIAPDLICAAKTLTGGVLPLAATLASPRIVNAFDTPERTRTFFHGHSFTAHPLACAVAVANWTLARQSCPATARRLEGFWQQSLANLRHLPNVSDVRIRGSIAALELDVPGGYLAEVGRQLRATCLEHDVLLRPLGSVLYALPPLRISEPALTRIAAALVAAAGLS